MECLPVGKWGSPLSKSKIILWRSILEHLCAWPERVECSLYFHCNVFVWLSNDTMYCPIRTLLLIDWMFGLAKTKCRLLLFVELDLMVRYQSTRSNDCQDICLTYRWWRCIRRYLLSININMTSLDPKVSSIRVSTTLCTQLLPYFKLHLKSLTPIYSFGSVLERKNGLSQTSRNCAHCGSPQSNSRPSGWGPRSGDRKTCGIPPIL